MGYDPRDRTVFITGASGGIGRACAVAFHRAGARIFATARSVDRLQALADELGDNRVAFHPLDATDPAQRVAAIQQCRERFGPIDVLINNAGWAAFGTTHRIPPEHVDRMLALNLVAPIALIREVLPAMLERGAGQIINISSVVGNQAIPRMSIYSATKAALTSLSTGLRMELRGTGVDVICIAPSSTRTAFFDSAAAVDVKAARLAQTQYSAERVAQAVVRASQRRTTEVVLSVEGKLISLIRRCSHRLADAIMYRVAKRAMPTTGSA